MQTLTYAVTLLCVPSPQEDPLLVPPGGPLVPETQAPPEDKDQVVNIGRLSWMQTNLTPVTEWAVDGVMDGAAEADGSGGMMSSYSKGGQAFWLEGRIYFLKLMGQAIIRYDEIWANIWIYIYEYISLLIS